MGMHEYVQVFIGIKGYVWVCMGMQKWTSGKLENVKVKNQKSGNLGKQKIGKVEDRKIVKVEKLEFGKVENWKIENMKSGNLEKWKIEKS